MKTSQSYTSKITSEQRERAEKILSIVSLKIELEIVKLGFTSWILGEEEVPAEFYDDLDQEYFISNEPTENGNYLTVKGKNRRLLIEMLDGQLIIADGIEELDLEYWLNVEKSFTN